MKKLTELLAAARAKWNKKKQVKEDYSLATPPLLLVPGTGGKISRFDKLIALLEEKQPVAVLKITVQEDDTLLVSGSLAIDNTRPVVVIAFSDASEAAVPKQAHWFRKALMYLEEHFQVRAYDYFGHSNGGLVITEYLENVCLSIDPQVRFLLLTGTPFDGVRQQTVSQAANQLQQNPSESLKNYLVKQSRLPSNLDVVLVAGEKNDSNSDGIVPVISVAAGLQLYAEANSCRFVLVKGVGHSQLVTHETVVHLIADELWHETVK